LKFLDPFAGKECGSEKGLLEMGLRSVYYAELRGEKAAIKKMESQGSKAEGFITWSSLEPGLLNRILC